MDRRWINFLSGFRYDRPQSVDLLIERGPFAFATGQEAIRRRRLRQQRAAHRKNLPAYRALVAACEFLMQPLPMPLGFVVFALLLAFVQVQTENSRARLVGLVLLVGVLLGAHLSIESLREFALTKGPYAVVFWTLMGFVCSILFLSWLTWLGWFVN